MVRLKEMLLNLLLAGLVLSSLFLTALVWFSTDRVGATGTQPAHVQSAPPTLTGSMPDPFRPERIYVRLRNNQVAVLQAGSKPYQETWAKIEQLLTGVHAFTAPALVEPLEGGDVESISLIFSAALPVDEWADHWSWATSNARNTSIRADRITLNVGQNPAMYMSASSGAYYQLGQLSADDQKLLLDLIDQMDGSLFSWYRPLAAGALSIRVAPGILVPDVTAVPMAEAEIRKPDGTTEEARYFPDLSVVRQIDERDARSFTDGQRLLRLTASGQLEYRTANKPGTGPDLSQALQVAQEWIEARDGWPTDLVLAAYERRSEKTTLIFEIRADGPYPVESADGAIRIDVTVDPGATTPGQVTFVRRFPEVSVSFAESVQPVISPEKALQRVDQEFSNLLLNDTVREVHLAYLVRSKGWAGEMGWVTEPVWSMRIGAERLYLPALVKSDLRPFVANPDISL